MPERLVVHLSTLNGLSIELQIVYLEKEAELQWKEFATDKT